MKPKREWTYKEWHVPCPIGINNYVRLCGQETKPLTEKEKKLLDQAFRLIEEARKWKKPNH